MSASKRKPPTQLASLMTLQQRLFCCMLLARFVWTVVATTPWAHYRVLLGHSSCSCALLIDDSVWCWGNSEYCQLGDGSHTGHSTPVEVIGLC